MLLHQRAHKRQSAKPIHDPISISRPACPMIPARLAARAAKTPNCHNVFATHKKAPDPAGSFEQIWACVASAPDMQCQTSGPQGRFWRLSATHRTSTLWAGYAFRHTLCGPTRQKTMTSRDMARNANWQGLIFTATNAMRKVQRQALGRISSAGRASHS